MREHSLFVLNTIKFDFFFDFFTFKKPFNTTLDVAQAAQVPVVEAAEDSKLSKAQRQRMRKKLREASS